MCIDCGQEGCEPRPVRDFPEDACLEVLPLLIRNPRSPVCLNQAVGVAGEHRIICLRSERADERLRENILHQLELESVERRWMKLHEMHLPEIGGVRDSIDGMIIPTPFRPNLLEGSMEA